MSNREILVLVSMFCLKVLTLLLQTVKYNQWNPDSPVWNMGLIWSIIWLVHIMMIHDDLYDQNEWMKDLQLRLRDPKMNLGRRWGVGK